MDVASSLKTASHPRCVSCKTVLELGVHVTTGSLKRVEDASRPPHPCSEIPTGLLYIHRRVSVQLLYVCGYMPLTESFPLPCFFVFPGRPAFLLQLSFPDRSPFFSRDQAPVPRTGRRKDKLRAEPLARAVLKHEFRSGPTDPPEMQFFFTCIFASKRKSMCSKMERISRV